MSEVTERAVGLWAKSIAQTLPLLKELLEASEPVTGLFRICQDRFLPLLESSDFWNQLHQVGLFFDGIVQMAQNDLQTLSELEELRRIVEKRVSDASSSFPEDFWKTLSRAMEKHRVWISFMKKESQNAQINRGVLASFFRYEKSLKELLEIELLAMEGEKSKVPVQEQIQWQRFFYLLCRLEGELETVNQAYQSIILELEPFFSGTLEKNLQHAIQIAAAFPEKSSTESMSAAGDLQTLSGYLRMI